MERVGLLARLGIQHPIIQAPMAGGPTTPELVAAVSNAGGLGSLGAAYLSPEQLLEAIRRIRQLTDKPFNVNLFAGGGDARPADAEPMLALLRPIHQRLGLAPPALGEPAPDRFPAQFEALLEARPAVFSFTFGIPAAARIQEAKARGIAVVGTATSAGEAGLLAQAGVDAIVAQGAEAGGHRGSFAVSFEAGLVPLRRLVEESLACELPVIASGGLMSGAEIAALLALGASAVQLGTAFLACPESGAAEAHKRSLLAARADTSVVTRAFSGRPARGLRNAFIDLLEARPQDILPYPWQNALTRPMRTAAAKRGEAGLMSLWAGTGAARSRALPAGELVRLLASELAQARRAG